MQSITSVNAINLSKTISLFFSTILLLGCATLATKQPTAKATSWQQHQQQLLAMTSWHAVGKIGISNANRGSNANLDWQQNEDHYTINLYGPFRTENLELIGKPGAIKLVTAAGVNQTATTPEAIIKKELGCNVPVTGLKYWARGLPIPNIPIESIQLSKENKLDQLKQQGWTIQYHEYQAFNQLILPTKITLYYQQIKIKLIFKNWI